MTIQQQRLLWILWVLLGIAGTIYSLLPGPVASRVWQGGSADHAIAFTAWSLVGGIVARKGQILRTVAVMLAVGIFIELAQLRVPGRAFEWIDLVEDFSGIALGIGVILLYRLREPAPPAPEAVLTHKAIDDR